MSYCHFDDESLDGVYPERSRGTRDKLREEDPGTALRVLQGRWKSHTIE